MLAQLFSLDFYTGNRYLYHGKTNTEKLSFHSFRHRAINHPSTKLDRPAPYLYWRRRYQPVIGSSQYASPCGRICLKVIAIDASHAIHQKSKVYVRGLLHRARPLNRDWGAKDGSRAQAHSSRAHIAVSELLVEKAFLLCGPRSSEARVS